jgi:hypothetical protein
MTTPYSVSSHLGSVSYNSYVHAPINGPLSTDKTPHAMEFHSHGILHGARQTPPQFYASQEPVYANMNTNARKQYLRTAIGDTVKAQQLALGKMSVPQSYVINSSQRKVPTSSHVNYVAPLASSLHLDILKSNAIGRTAYSQTATQSSTKNYTPSSTRNAIRRARSSGCVAPKKKGAIENVYAKYY